MTVFEKKQFKIDFATTQAIKTKNQVKRFFWVVRLRLAQWQMYRFMKWATIEDASKEI